MDYFGSEDDGLAEVVFIAPAAACAFGIHVGDADAALLVGLKTLAGGHVVEHGPAHGMDMAQKVDEFIGLGSET